MLSRFIGPTEESKFEKLINENWIMVDVILAYERVKNQTPALLFSGIFITEYRNVAAGVEWKLLQMYCVSCFS